jgi:hypothetical protein
MTRLFRWLERRVEWLFGTPPFDPNTSATLAAWRATQ